MSFDYLVYNVDKKVEYIINASDSLLGWMALRTEKDN